MHGGGFGLKKIKRGKMKTHFSSTSISSSLSFLFTKFTQSLINQKLEFRIERKGIFGSERER
jgi:hypothetical protein